MNNKKNSKFPKNFFKIKRPVITFNEATKDDYPFEWNNDASKKCSIKKVTKNN